MASYPWSTKIQAYLAKIAGKEVENLPEPTTKEQALLKEIAENGGSGGGSTDVVIADTQTVSGTVRGGSFMPVVDYSLTPTANYADPSTYIRKMLRAEVTRNGVTSVLTGQVSAEESEGVTYIGAPISPDSFSDPVGYIELSDGAITFISYNSTADDLTIKLEVLSSPGALLVRSNPNTDALNATWQEIHDALIVQGVPVLIDGRLVSEIYYDPDYKYGVKTISEQGGVAVAIRYKATTSGDYPVRPRN